MDALRIVIAEDEPVIRMDLRRTLENMGHVVIGEAGDGARAVDIAVEPVAERRNGTHLGTEREAAE